MSKNYSFYPLKENLDKKTKNTNINKDKENEMKIKDHFLSLRLSIQEKINRTIESTKNEKEGIKLLSKLISFIIMDKKTNYR